MTGYAMDGPTIVPAIQLGLKVLRNHYLGNWTGCKPPALNLIQIPSPNKMWTLTENLNRSVMFLPAGEIRPTAKGNAGPSN
jgi:hypothetical protein